MMQIVTVQLINIGTKIILLNVNHVTVLATNVLEMLQINALFVRQEDIYLMELLHQPVVFVYINAILVPTLPQIVIVTVLIQQQLRE